MVGFSFVSDIFTEWRQFSGQNKVTQSWISLNSELKIALMQTLIRLFSHCTVSMAMTFYTLSKTTTGFLWFPLNRQVQVQLSNTNGTPLVSTKTSFFFKLKLFNIHNFSTWLAASIKFRHKERGKIIFRNFGAKKSRMNIYYTSCFPGRSFTSIPS